MYSPCVNLHKRPLPCRSTRRGPCRLPVLLYTSLTAVLYTPEFQVRRGRPEDNARHQPCLQGIMSGVVIDGAALCDVNEDELAGNDSSRTCILPVGSMDTPTLGDPRQDDAVEVRYFGYHNLH